MEYKYTLWNIYNIYGMEWNYIYIYSGIYIYIILHLILSGILFNNKNDKLWMPTII